MPEQLVLSIFLAFFAIEFFIEFALNELNLRHVRACWAAQQIPDFIRDKIGPEDYQKSVQYTLAKGSFQRWAEPYDRLVTLVLLFGVLAYVDQFAGHLAQQVAFLPYGQGIWFCLAIGLLALLAGLPTDIYSTFYLEGKFGFNKTTAGLYLADKLKGLVLALVIGVPFLFVIFWLMDTMGKFWWLWAFVFVSLFQLLMIVIFPTFIAPWFNKFEPLKEGELRERILALAKQLGFTASGIYTMDGSKRSAHSNAYFTGIGKAKRIVLFDTLIEQMTIEQGLAVLAHEMGHYKMKHIRRMLVVQMILLFVGLYVVNLLLHWPAFFNAFGLSPSNHAALVLFSLVSGPVTFYLEPLLNYLSRKHEYEADRFAAMNLRDGKPMTEALINLTVKNLANLNPHPWYSAYHFSHPSAAERVSALRQGST